MAARAFAFVAGLILLVLLAGALRSVLAPFFIALAIAYLLSPAVDFLERRGMGRVWAVVAIYAVLLVVLGGGLALLAPRLSDELQRLAAALPGLVKEFEALLQAAQKGYARVVLPPPCEASWTRR
ncbi:MAG: AI-2E family transporter [Acetobacteraceae bacterium]|nr:AI-2E family transporter [Acetobacteraceae bacterium]